MQMARRFPFLARSAGTWLPYALYVLGGLLLYSGAAAAFAWHRVPVGMEPRRWAIIAAIAAPVWAAGGLAVALLVDVVSQFLFKRDAFGWGLGLVFLGTMLLNVGGGRVGLLCGLSLGALFAVGLGVCAVILPIALIQRHIEQRRKVGGKT